MMRVHDTAVGFNLVSLAGRTAHNELLGVRERARSRRRRKGVHMNDSYHIGMHVLASDGDAGVVEDILTTAEGVPQYLVVRDRGVFARDVVLPIADTTSDGAAVHVARTRTQIHAMDRYDPSRHGEHAGLFSAAARAYDRTKDADEEGTRP
jgi:hypothetical protein